MNAARPAPSPSPGSTDAASDSAFADTSKSLQSEPSGETSDEDLARLALREVASSARAPASARAAAARTLLEAGGLIGRLQEKPRNTKGLHEMSREELEAEIARLRAPEASDDDGMFDPHIS